MVEPISRKIGRGALTFGELVSTEHPEIVEILLLLLVDDVTSTEPADSSYQDRSFCRQSSTEFTTFFYAHRSLHDYLFNSIRHR